jgi:hypothetical protein
MPASIIEGNEYGTVGANRSYVFPNKNITTLQGDNAGNGHQIVLTDRVYIQPNQHVSRFVLEECEYLNLNCSRSTCTEVWDLI